MSKRRSRSAIALLCDKNILHSIDKGYIKIDNFSYKNLDTHCYHLTLADKYHKYQYKGKLVNAENNNCWGPELKANVEKNQGGDSYIIIQPNETLLCYTKEKVAVSKYITYLSAGDDNIKMHGIYADVLPNNDKSASPLTLVIRNVNSKPVLLCTGIKVAHITFFYTDNYEKYECSGSGISKKSTIITVEPQLSSLSINDKGNEKVESTKEERKS